jgi:ribosome assembly protein 4
MATRLPPPKRVKVYHGVPEPEPEPSKPSPNIVVQFVSEEDGRALAPPVNLPANTSREGLEAVLNRLSTQVRATGNVKKRCQLFCHPG